jgi:hypothetical protein
VPKVVIGILVLALLMLAVPAYLRLGWNRMTDQCARDLDALVSNGVHEGPDSHSSGSVSYSWEWPKGFTCTFSDGTKRQSLWF